MSLTAVIVAYQSEAIIRGCVSALLRSSQCDIVVWDNSSGGLTEQALGDIRDPRIRVLQGDGNVGFGAGVNRAADRADPVGDLLLINPDCVVSPEAVAQLLKVQLDQDAAIVAPRMVYGDGGPGIAGGPRPSLVKEIAAWTRIDDLIPPKWRRKALQAFSNPFSRSSALGGYGEALVKGPALEFDWVSGFCMLVSREYFDRVGGFDEEFFLYFEDVDFCERVRKSGGRVVLAREEAVLHYESSSTNAQGQKGQFYRDGMTRYFIKNGSIGERF
ncbi:MAG: glycosyltransferase family 2 protein, partial [Frondihabitans sp.]|nr:glycosyltransferase family 2 protein [Frondihabitans sp.]